MVTNADWDGLTARVKDLEEFREKVKPAMWLIGWSKAIAGLFAGLFGGMAIGGLVYVSRTTAVLENEAKHQTTDLAKLDTSLSARLDKLEARLEKVAERAMRYGGGGAGALALEGLVVKADGKELILETPSKQTVTIKLTPETKVTIKGELAKPNELKPGMHVWVMEGEKGILIETGLGPAMLPAPLWRK